MTPEFLALEELVSKHGGQLNEIASHVHGLYAVVSRIESCLSQSGFKLPEEGPVPTPYVSTAPEVAPTGEAGTEPEVIGRKKSEDEAEAE